MSKTTAPVRPKQWKRGDLAVLGGLHFSFEDEHPRVYGDRTYEEHKQVYEGIILVLQTYDLEQPHDFEPRLMALASTGQVLSVHCFSLHRF